MKDKTQERLARLQELIQERELIEREIEMLLSPEKEVVLPPGFSTNVEVLSVLKEAGSAGMAKSRVLKALQDKYPHYGIDQRKVASALAYLKNTKKQIALIGRGMYKVNDVS